MLKLRLFHPMTWRISFVALAACSAATGLSRAADLPPLRSDRPPQFAADVVISLHSDGRPALGVSVSLPYDQLQWLRTPKGYAGAAEFTVVFEPAKGVTQIGDDWDRSLLIPDFRSTLSSDVCDIERRTFDVPPGHYRVRVAVRDLNSGEVSAAQDQIEVPDYSQVPFGLAGLELGVVDTTGTFDPVPARSYGVNVLSFAAQVVLFDRRPGTWPRSYPLRYRILDDTGSEVAAGSRTVSLDRPSQPVVVAPDTLGLFLGSYVFELELGEARSKWRVERSFDIEESGPPRGREFERMLEPLAFIAEAKDVDALRNLPPDQQAAGWEEFWKRRDPTPDTPRNEAMLEFFRRIRYAERHFQTFGPGWRSDMGRIYIRYGPPDQIENRPSTSTSASVEIWYYNRPYRRFVFTDRDGFGRFVLLGPTYE